MTLTGVLEVIALVAAIAVAVYLVVVLTEFRRAMTAVESLARHADEHVVPLAHKASRTLEDINDELVKVEGIVDSIEDVSHRVSTTAEIARHALSSPLVKLAGWSAGMRKAVSTLAHEQTEDAPAAESDEEEGAGGKR